MKVNHFLIGILGVSALDVIAYNSWSNKADDQLSKPSIEDCRSYCTLPSSDGHCLKFDRAIGNICDSYLTDQQLLTLQ
ncbi:MAG TPA: hypothetical protein VIC26_06765 [Marinagarivorans sp.]